MISIYKQLFVIFIPMKVMHTVSQFDEKKLPESM